MSGSLDRDALIELLDDLAKRLRRRGVRAHVYVMGGAAMTLAFARERTTRGHELLSRIFQPEDEPAPAPNPDA